MADCPLCNKVDAQGNHPYLIRTAIQTTTRVKTGFKQYMVTTRTFSPEDHRYIICDTCETKYNQIIPYSIWAVGILLAILAFIFVEHEDPMLVLFCVSPMPLALAFFLTSSFFSSNAKLKNKALKDRRATAGAQTVVAYTEKEYERLLKKNKQSRF